MGAIALLVNSVALSSTFITLRHLQDSFQQRVLLRPLDLVEDTCSQLCKELLLWLDAPILLSLSKILKSSAPPSVMYGSDKACYTFEKGFIVPTMLESFSGQTLLPTATTSSNSAADSSNAKLVVIVVQQSAPHPPCWGGLWKPWRAFLRLALAFQSSLHQLNFN